MTASDVTTSQTIVTGSKNTRWRYSGSLNRDSSPCKTCKVNWQTIERQKLEFDVFNTNVLLFYLLLYTLLSILRNSGNLSCPGANLACPKLNCFSHMQHACRLDNASTFYWGWGGRGLGGGALVFIKSDQQCKPQIQVSMSMNMHGWNENTRGNLILNPEWLSKFESSLHRATGGWLSSHKTVWQVWRLMNQIVLSKICKNQYRYLVLLTNWCSRTYTRYKALPQQYLQLGIQGQYTIIYSPLAFCSKHYSVGKLGNNKGEVYCYCYRYVCMWTDQWPRHV